MTWVYTIHKQKVLDTNETGEGIDSKDAMKEKESITEGGNGEASFVEAATKKLLQIGIRHSPTYTRCRRSDAVANRWWVSVGKEPRLDEHGVLQVNIACVSEAWGKRRLYVRVVE